MHRLTSSPWVPILGVEEAKAFEEGFFARDEEAEWKAMREAGRAVARRALLDFQEIGKFPPDAKVLVLVGKGHNGGDALLAAAEILTEIAGATADVLFAGIASDRRALVQRAYRDLQHKFASRLRLISLEQVARGYDLSLDGVFGFQFRPPLRPETLQLFSAVESCHVRMRVAIDLPSGLGDEHALQADFTYATGSVKRPLIKPGHLGKTGRVRYLDLGFFAKQQFSDPRHGVALTPAILDTFRGWRDPASDKRHFGHLLVIGGSMRYPGAIMMTVQAALKAGVGLLTACVPEPLVAAYAAQVPEAMWVGCPLTPSGGIALESFHIVREVSRRTNAIVAGPGLGREPETLAMLGDLFSEWTGPVVLDADALQGELVARVKGSKILTPHAGEYARIGGKLSAAEFSLQSGSVVVMKGPMTRICDPEGEYYCLAGGPVLARGGSGDILAGMIAGLAAQEGITAVSAACAGVVWHAMAADALARARGQASVSTTQLLEFMPEALRLEAPL